MLTIAERAGFPKVIIVRNGIEGTIAFPLLRPAQLLYSVRQKDGTYVREALKCEHPIVAESKFTLEEKLEPPFLDRNIELIRQYHTQGKSGNDFFDARVEVTVSGIKQALDLMNQENT